MILVINEMLADHDCSKLIRLKFSCCVIIGFSSLRTRPARPRESLLSTLLRTRIRKEDVEHLIKVIPLFLLHRHENASLFFILFIHQRSTAWIHFCYSVSLWCEPVRSSYLQWNFYDCRKTTLRRTDSSCRMKANFTRINRVQVPIRYCPSLLAQNN